MATLLLTILLILGPFSMTGQAGPSPTRTAEATPDCMRYILNEYRFDTLEGTPV